MARVVSANPTGEEPYTRMAVQIPDHELIIRIARNRDEEAFGLFFQRFQRTAYNLARHICGHDGQAEEAVQEAMIRLWVSAETFRPGNARGWFLKIVAREGLKVRQRKSRNRAHEVEGPHEQAEPVAAGETPPEDTETLALLRAHMEQLPSEGRRLIALYFGSGMTHQEIGEALSMPTRTVSFKIEQVVTKLRRTLAGAGATAVLATEVLSQAVGSGGDCPDRVLDAALHSVRRGPVPHPPDSDAKVSLEPSAPMLFKGLLGGGLALMALGFIAFYAGHQAPSSATKSSPQPGDLANVQPPAPSSYYWTFSQGPDNSIPVGQGAWRWQKPSGKKPAGMLVTADEPVIIRLPVKFSGKPQRIDLKAVQASTKDGAHFNAFLARDQTVLGHQAWHRVLPVGDLTRVSAYIFDRYLLVAVGNQVNGVAQYPAEVHGNGVILKLSNMIIQEISLKECEKDKIPQFIRDPENLKALMDHGPQKIIEEDVTY